MSDQEPSNPGPAPTPPAKPVEKPVDKPPGDKPGDKSGARAEPPPAGEGPGARYVRVRGVGLTAAYLIAVGAFCLYLVIVLWPHPTPSGDLPPKDGATTGGAATKNEVPEPTDKTIAPKQDWLCGKGKECRDCVAQVMHLQFETQRRGDPQCIYIFGRHLVVWQEERLLLLVLLAGAVGALLHAIRSLVAYVGNRNFVGSWLAFYYLSPFSGSMIAFVTYAAIRGGFFASTSTTGDANPFMFIALATLAGLFSHQVMEKLRKVAETAFDKPPEGKNPLPAGKPVIAAINPSPVPAGYKDSLTINGSGFVKGSLVHVGATVAKTTIVSAKQLTFLLPEGVADQPTTLKVVVVTPAPEDGISEEATLVVEAKKPG